MTITYTLKELPNVAKQIITDAGTGIISFDAAMGVGKTTLIKEICRQLGVQDTISSPTYALVNEYKSDDGPVYHFDFYRINDEEEAYHIGFEEYLDLGAWVFIEWPEKISNILPEDIIRIKIDLIEDGKRVLSYY